MVKQLLKHNGNTYCKSTVSQFKIVFFYLDSRTDFPSSKLFLEKTVLGQCIFDTIPLDLLINY